MTNLDQFIEAVNRMRIAQRDYFKKPITGKLIVAKKLERLVDEMLDEHFGIQQLPFTEPATSVELQSSTR